MLKIQPDSHPSPAFAFRGNAVNNRTARNVLTRFVLFPLLTLAGIAALAWAWVFAPGAAAQGADVQITELDCNSDPEVVSVTNQGQADIAMSGWNLQSDPTSQESLPLSQFGFLSPGETLIVESGPSAEGAFVWSKNLMFRDNDPTDFAQLASDAGQVLLRVNCGAALQQTATPAATVASTPTPAAATPAPSPIATALAAVTAPLGGGPPEVGAMVPPGLLIAVGSGLLSAGLGTFALPFGGRRRRKAATAITDPVTTAQHTESVSMIPAANVAKATGNSNPETSVSPRSPYIFMAMIGLLLVAVLLFLLQFGEQKRE